MQRANEEYNQKHGMRTVMLDEVIVTAKRMQKYRESKYYSSIYALGLVTARDMEKRNYSSFRSLLRSNPSLNVSGFDKVSTIHSDKPVLFIIDDVIYEFRDIESIDLDIANINDMFVITSVRLSK